MRIEHKKTVKVDELAEIVPREAGATWSALWQVFYYTRLFKYVHKRHYPKIKKSFNKICTHDKLQKLCALGYFKNPQKDVYCATNKVLAILKEVGFIIDILPSEPIGKGDINELNNTGAFISLLKQPYFHTLLYPHFGYIIPDALMVQLDTDLKRYKLTFIEVESRKPEWEQYIQSKKSNYRRLSKDMAAYKYWERISKFLNIAKPSINDFKFTYRIITNA
jgi:hypothetical protein